MEISHSTVYKIFKLQEIVQKKLQYIVQIFFFSFFVLRVRMNEAEFSPNSGVEENLTSKYLELEYNKIIL